MVQIEEKEANEFARNVDFISLSPSKHSQLPTATGAATEDFANDKNIELYEEVGEQALNREDEHKTEIAELRHKLAMQDEQLTKQKQELIEAQLQLVAKDSHIAEQGHQSDMLIGQLENVAIGNTNNKWGTKKRKMGHLRADGKAPDCPYWPMMKCKRGSECKYTHAPREYSIELDCMFWLEEKCIYYSKCRKRHLEGKELENAKRKHQELESLRKLHQIKGVGGVGSVDADDSSNELDET
jgi:hypothetical protein